MFRIIFNTYWKTSGMRRTNMNIDWEKLSYELWDELHRDLHQQSWKDSSWILKDSSHSSHSSGNQNKEKILIKCKKNQQQIIIKLLISMDVSI